MATTATKPATPRKQFSLPSGIRGGYDVARTNSENANLWKYVDGLSAAAANNPQVRKTIRERARYETSNNSYADGIIDTLAADTIGAEVQLQLGDSDTAQAVEAAFSRWAREINLWGKLRVMRRAKCVDGEAFAVLATNPAIQGRVKLDVQPIECDMVESYFNQTKENEIDGIRFDKYGNPTHYRILDGHPGDHRNLFAGRKGTWTRSEFVIHYFHEIRPGAVRGVSELVPALSLFGELRQFTKAVLQSAARAAEISAIMQTTMVQEAVELVDPLTVIQAERNAIVSLPEGWTLQQMKPEQPVATYAMFKREIVNEIARCLNMPYNVAACDSSSYNYASGRLDHQTYDRSVDVERATINTTILRRVYQAWFAEYAALAGLTPQERNDLQQHDWHYSSRGHVDPNKEATADNTRLQNGTMTLARYWAKQGSDHKREMQQWITEQIDMELEWNKARKAAGLPPAPFPGGAKQITERRASNEQDDDRD